MVTRFPGGRAGLTAREAALGALQAEMLNERVLALGRAGRRAEHALAALGAFDGPEGSEAHEMLLDEAAAQVWSFIVQRELCGFRDTAAVVSDFAIPKAVIARIGVARRLVVP